jgi:hypothetical protein
VVPHILLRGGFEAGEVLTGGTVKPFALQGQTLLAALRAGLYMVGAACYKQGVSLQTLAEAELADLAQKSYLAGLE